jgi:hypothetical protein
MEDFILSILLGSMALTKILPGGRVMQVIRQACNAKVSVWDMDPDDYRSKMEIAY